MLWQADYDTPPSWQALQQAAPGRITVASNPPGSGAARPGGNAMHVQLVAGDRVGISCRAEAYARAPVPMSGTPPQGWPDPAGAVRWYGWSLLVPTGFAFATDTKWLVTTQWKGYQGGSPPISVEIRRSGLVLGGTRTNAGLIPGNGALGPITAGRWTRLAVGLSLAPDPAAGWVEVWRDGAQAIPRTPVATMDLIGGQPDPIYLKQGIYRDPTWVTTHDLYFGPITIGQSLADVA